MKKNRIIGFIATAMLLAHTAHADFAFFSSEPNACDLLAGHWNGSGKASNWLIGDCIYTGTGTVGPVNNAGGFTLEVSGDKNSGSFLCPAHANTTLNGTCINGTVTIATGYGDMSGTFTQNSGNASGKLTVSPGIDAEVRVQFQRG